MVGILYILIDRDMENGMIFGTPSYESIQLMKHSVIVPEWKKLGIFDAVYEMPYPSDERTVIGEVTTLAVMNKLVDHVRYAQNVEIDQHMFRVWSVFLQTLGITVGEDELKQIVAPYDPIIDYLKLIYNRPRPHQVAGMYNIPLFPRLNHVPLTASYPSGHTLLSLYIYEYYVRRHPELTRQLMGKVLDIKLSREEGGVHYPSDGIFSFKIYRHIKPYLWT